MRSIGRLDFGSAPESHDITALEGTTQASHVPGASWLRDDVGNQESREAEATNGGEPGVGARPVEPGSRSCRRAVPGDRRAASRSHLRSRADGARLASVPILKGGSGGPTPVGDPRTLLGAPGVLAGTHVASPDRRSHRTESATSAPRLRRTMRPSPSGGLGASRVRRRKAVRAGACVGAARKLRPGDTHVPRHRARHPSHRHPLVRRPDVGTSDRDRRTWIPLPLPPTVGAMPWDLPPATTGGP